MDILLITSDHLLRDQVKVGLQQFPEFRVTCGESFQGINMLHLTDFDYAFLELGHSTQDCLTLLDHMRTFDQTTEVVAVSDTRTVRDLSREKQKWGISAFLTTPIDVTDFFRLVARLRSRREEAIETAGSNANAN